MQTPSPAWVRALRPYAPGKPVAELERELGIEGAIKLASNENPLGPSPAAMEAMRRAIGDVHIYPDAATWTLREALSGHVGTSADEIIVGNGSNELITLLVRAFATPDTNAVIGEYAFIAYRVVLGAAGVETRIVPMPELTHDLGAMASQCDDDTRIVFVANPNNPTGTYNTEKDLRAFLRAVPEHVLVVLDEAYVEYCDAGDTIDGLKLRDERENLVLLRTFSKAYGMAGARVGYGVAPRYVVDLVNRIREPFNVNTLAQVGATDALGDAAFISKSVYMNRLVKRDLCDALDSLGIGYVPSQGNFILIDAPHGGIRTYDALLHRGVIVRPLAPYGLNKHLRVSLGTVDENKRLIEALEYVYDAFKTDAP